MAFPTGCTGPFKRGTGGICGCECKCCPPTCSGVVSVLFDCGGPQSTANPLGCVFGTSFAANDFGMPPIPEFSKGPVISEDKRFIFGQAVTTCSVPCETVCVPVKCGGNNCPCCCIEICGDKLLSVGNGFVTAPATVELEGCLTFTVLINGLPPPVFVCDAEEIVVTIEPDPADDCCKCEQISIQPGCCPATTATLAAFTTGTRKALWRAKIDPFTGKPKINPVTGKRIPVLNKQELIRRYLAKKLALLRSKQR